MKLTAQTVRSAKKPGKLHDGGGLFLLVQPSGSKSWVLRTVVQGKRRDIGLGGFPLVSLAQARATALEYRRVARSGGDPTATETRAPSFQTAADRVLAIRAGKWRPGSTSEADWRASLENYVIPVFGSKGVDAIDSSDVLAAVSPIWHQRPVAAKRVLQRIGVVLRWAEAAGHRDTDPTPAVRTALGDNTKRPQHLAAIPHAQVGAAIAKVRGSNVHPSLRLAFEFAVLTACRSGEVRGACRAEIGLDDALWEIPETRTKAGRQHAVPLTPRAIAILAEARRHHPQSELIFPREDGRELAAWELSRLAANLELGGTLHGFRTSFRTWAAEIGAAREVAEAALGHQIPNAAERAYQRSGLLELRRSLMEKWEGHIK